MQMLTILRFVYYIVPMAGTYQRRRGGSATDLKPRKGLKSPASSKKPNGRRRKDIQARILRRASIASLCCVVAALAFIAGGYLGLVRGVENLNEASAGPSHPTYIYSTPIGETPETTRVIGTIFQGENRQEASLKDMPSSLLDALVAKEDERFREHAGVDLLSIMRALWIDIRMGGAVEGASTITQQYVRNAYLTGDRSLARKVKEAAIAIEVERKYQKDEILGMYLNTVYFGSNAYGVEAAAETYFNKSAEELTVSDSATLIGLLWSPSSLGNNPEEAMKQRNFVLYKMRDAGYITRQEHMKALDEALPEPWPKAPMVETGLTGPPETKNFAEFVREELVKRYGTNAVLTGGLSVYTTLDLKAQVTAQKMLYDPNGYLGRPQDPDAALVSVEPGTGHITTMVGSRDEKSQFNLVTQARRQPGSSFKPFALIAALEQGIDPSTQFFSEKKTYTIKDENGRAEEWEVENYENEDHGTTDLRHALWLSDNSVFTDLVMNVDGKGLTEGAEAVVDVAKRLGITADLKAHPSIVLGTQEVSPMDMAIAYATIANGGEKVTPTAIEKVVQNEGQENEKILDAAAREEGEQVIAPEVARKATEIMVGNIDHGIAQKASLGDRPAAGKTGTSENFFDSWFIGFTPQLVTGVWMGYEKGGQTLNGLLNIGGRQLGPLAPPTVIWQRYMKQVLKDEPVKKFENMYAPQSPILSNTPSPAESTGGAIPTVPPGAGPTGGATPGPFPSPTQPGVPLPAPSG
jgi:membrane peptidoglycan carboxypeptidase